MWRADRQVKDINRIKEFVKECKVCRVGMWDGKEVYVVPMNYGYEEENGETITIYLHCAKVGKKHDILVERPDVCIEMDGKHELKEGPIPCQYGFYYESFIGNGTVEFVEDFEEKVKALSITMKHQTGKDFTEFGEKWVNAVCIFKVKMNQYTVKEYNKGMK